MEVIEEIKTAPIEQKKKKQHTLRYRVQTLFDFLKDMRGMRQRLFGWSYPRYGRIFPASQKAYLSDEHEGYVQKRRIINYNKIHAWREEKTMLNGYIIKDWIPVIKIGFSLEEIDCWSSDSCYEIIDEKKEVERIEEGPGFEYCKN